MSQERPASPPSLTVFSPRGERILCSQVDLVRWGAGLLPAWPGSPAPYRWMSPGAGPFEDGGGEWVSEAGQRRSRGGSGAGQGWSRGGAGRGCKGQGVQAGGAGICAPTQPNPHSLRPHPRRALWSSPCLDRRETDLRRGRLQPDQVLPQPVSSFAV